MSEPMSGGVEGVLYDSQRVSSERLESAVTELASVYAVRWRWAADLFDAAISATRFDIRVHTAEMALLQRTFFHYLTTARPDPSDRIRIGRAVLSLIGSSERHAIERAAAVTNKIMRNPENVGVDFAPEELTALIASEPPALEARSVVASALSRAVEHRMDDASSRAVVETALGEGRKLVLSFEAQIHAALAWLSLSSAEEIHVVTNDEQSG
ncbi:hypothetical protein [Sandaracinus amylolyticus]|nr:hypothetical protein [Sandaracinus amylolyticus]